jgi:UDP-glucose 4-epimerase
VANRVLITGAAGFIGRHIAREFSNQGWYVVGMGRGDWPDWQEYGISAWHRCDITSETLVEFVFLIYVFFYFAGGASVGFSIDQPSVDFDLTVRITSNVLEYIRLHSPYTKLVYPSSAAVYGQVKMLPITEGAPLNPLSPYGVHKQMAEALCQRHAQQFNLSVVIVRMFSIYGSGLRKQLLWDACRKFERGDCEYFGTGEEVRDWLHVDDVAKLLLAAVHYATPNCAVVNAGCGQGVLVKEILQHVSYQLGLGLNPKFSLVPKAGDPNAYVADISKALALGWEPKIKWREGVAEYVDWYKQCQ